MTQDDMQYDRSVYLEYLDIHEKAYRHKVKFVQEREQDISLLRDKDRIYIELDFMLSLFEIGDYERYVEYVDHQIETVIDRNIYIFKDKNIFNQLLQNKALSLYHLYRDEESLAISIQLKKLNKESEIPHYLIKQILKRKKRNWFIGVNGFVIFLILTTVAILFFELLVIRPFYPEFVGKTELIRNCTIGSSFLILFMNHIVLHLVATRQAHKK